MVTKKAPGNKLDKIWYESNLSAISPIFDHLNRSIIGQVIRDQRMLLQHLAGPRLSAGKVTVQIAKSEIQILPNSLLSLISEKGVTHLFLAAEKVDSKVTILSETNNYILSLLAATVLLPVFWLLLTLKEQNIHCLCSDKKLLKSKLTVCSATKGNMRRCMFPLKNSIMI